MPDMTTKLKLSFAKLKGTDMYDKKKHTTSKHICTVEYSINYEVCEGPKIM